MPNPLLLFAAQIVACMSVLLLAAGYLKTDPRGASARVFGIMAVFIACYLVNGMTGPNIDASFRLDLSAISLLMDCGISAICGLFMVYCFLIFQEQQRFPVILGWAFALQVSLDFLLSLSASTGVHFISERWSDWLDTGLELVQLGFVGLAILWTLRGWRADLVNDRRIFRWFIIGVQGVLIFVIALIESFLLPGGSINDVTGQAVIVYTIAILTLGMLLAAMRFDLVSLTDAIRKVAELSDESRKEGSRHYDVASFNEAFRGGKLYRQHGLTIAGLAGKLNLPEYRLRAFINKELGFRNFNAMLHKYRIEDASEALADRENRRVPILTIALSVGYQSITPFNNAFREIMGVTPSEYRRQHLD